jgi:predicted  nucleic acid-binding Zn-ribbon protein
MVNEIDLDKLGETLLDIQKLDTGVFDLKREIDGLEDKYRLGELREQLKEIKDRLAVQERSLEDLEHRQHKLDGELDILSEKIGKEEAKLFSGTIMNPKELSGIQAEILSLRKKRDEMETEDLEMMEEEDRINSEVKRAGGAVEEMSSREREALDSYERGLEEKEQHMKELEKERDTLKKAVDEDTLAVYHKLLEKKGGLAVVRIEKGSNCGGCHIQFSSSKIDQFQHEHGIFRCEYCRRILVR